MKRELLIEAMKSIRDRLKANPDTECREACVVSAKEHKLTAFDIADMRYLFHTANVPCSIGWPKFAFPGDVDRVIALASVNCDQIRVFCDWLATHESPVPDMGQYLRALADVREMNECIGESDE